MGLTTMNYDDNNDNNNGNNKVPKTEVNKETVGGRGAHIDKR